MFRDDDRARFAAYTAARARYEEAARAFATPDAWKGAAPAERRCAGRRTSAGPRRARWCRRWSTTTTRSPTASGAIVGAVDAAKTSIEVALVVAVLAAIVCGYLLLRAITVPMQSIVSLLGASAAATCACAWRCGAMTSSSPSRRASTRCRAS